MRGQIMKTNQINRKSKIVMLSMAFVSLVTAVGFTIVS